MTPRPMFPLGAVLLPGGAIPLHVFEPRYRAMVKDCLAGDGAFGVVLIERGSEVGGGDVRSGAGTLARVAEAQEMADGRWALIAVGVERLRVIEWLPEDPYPRAEVDPWPDPEPTAGFANRLVGALATLRRVVALAGELGDAVAPVPNQLADDPLLASYQACWLAPLSTFDKQRLLAAETPDDRLAMLEALLADEAEVLELRLGGS